MKHLKLLILMAFLFPVLRCEANTYNAANCNQTGANSLGALIAAASDGDTVNGPSGGGSSTWSGSVSSTHTIALINGNGCNITVNGTDIFEMTWTNASHIPRITDFTFNGYGATAMVNLNGNVPAFRVDHIKVNAVPHTGNPRFIWVNHVGFVRYYKDMIGLIDHITYNCTQDGTCNAFLFYGRDWNWLSAHTMGTANAIYIEDSSFTCTACTGQHFGTVTDAQHGARFVVRHSTIENMSISEHDVGVVLDRGTRQYEAYDNTFTCRGSSSASCFNAFAIRGGTNLIYNNSIQMDSSSGISGWEAVAYTEIFRLADPGLGQIPWNGILVANPNIIYAPGNAPGGSGPSTGGICSDFYPHATSSPYRYCDTQSASCYANPHLTSGNAVCGQATYTLLSDYTGGAIANTLLSQLDGTGSGGYPARDQTGAGPDTGANHVQTGGAEPLYIWNNTCGTGSPSCTTGAVIMNALHNGVNIGSFITANRDFYQDAKPFTGATGVGVGTLASRPSSCKPVVGYWATDKNTLYRCLTANTWTASYRPYTYPHPLQSGAAPDPEPSSPEPPTNLAIQVL
jgi:hypothetical protein